MNRLKFLLFVLIFGLVLNTGSAVFAQTQTRSYSYQKISDVITINKDTTFDVAETEELNFNGEYHQMVRTIPYNKIDNISDVVVLDGQTKLPLTPSASRLDKLNPTNWNKFTVYTSNNTANIEWYFDGKGSDRTWIVKYKIHGGLEFNKGSDRLYWNLFTNFTVPIAFSEATVILPDGVSVVGLKPYSYRTITKDKTETTNSANHSVYFGSSSFAPNEAYTIDISWPAGFINRYSYIKDFFNSHWKIILTILIPVLSYLIWKIFDGYRNGWWQRFAVIAPEFTPPEGLKPAMVEALYSQTLSGKGLSATIIDLAIRGYLKIEETKSESRLTNIIGIIVLSLMVLCLLGFTGFEIFSINKSERVGYLMIVVLMVIVIIRPLVKAAIGQLKNYKVIRQKEVSGKGVSEYETRYVNLLMPGKDTFETAKLAMRGGVAFRNKIKSFKKAFFDEVQTETSAFIVTPEKVDSLIGATWGFVIGGFLLSVFALRLNFQPSTFFLIISSCVSGFSLLFCIFFGPRLSQAGFDLRKKILGFKLYLQTAEKYRLQNLTPELFEKYLPYAVALGLEKQWAKKFSLDANYYPGWYYHSYGGHYYGSGSANSSFSPSGFSASFVSSFNSAFSSSAGGSGGGGGGGGGGSAGGGGGGGGGGAS